MSDNAAAVLIFAISTATAVVLILGALWLALRSDK